MSHMLSLGQAARLADVGKTTVARAIQSGRLSATRKADGGYEIDPAELCRVYECKIPGATAETVAGDGRAERDATPPGTGRDAETEKALAAAEARIEGLKQVVESERRRAEEAIADRDRWAAQAERLALLAPPPAPPAVPAPPERRTFLGRIFRAA
ncbi:hypothetical protein [Methylobacterium sp. J-030]|uniref:hypothetical protein n=1 Tax=Methylobacterium sp. J-030 TaxID=2836627 RepID=UPI00391A11B7